MSVIKINDGDGGGYNDSDLSCQIKSFYSVVALFLTLILTVSLFHI